MKTIKNPFSVVVTIHHEDEAQNFQLGDIVELNGSRWMVVKILPKTHLQQLVLDFPEAYLEGEELRNYLEEIPPTP